ncbi:MAG: hypothetical protein Q4D20_06605 [Clostridia bacterium]|nr:hypothetical protein [Clostridia bacterium]
MKKLKSFLIFLLVTVMLASLTGCGKSRKIAELQEEISKYNTQINEKEDELERWQSIYDKAKEAYDHSAGFDNYEIQQEREKVKGYMDEARREVVKLERDIELLKCSRRISQRSLYELMD